MNYGYDQTSEGFDPSRMDNLAARLRAMLTEFTPQQGRPAYVEVDEAHPEHGKHLYAGVRIRKLTDYSDDDRDRIIRRADAIYCDVMGVPT